MTPDLPRGWGGPRVQETLLRADTAPSKGGPKLLGHREGGRSGCKTKTAGGSVSPSKSGPDYYLAVQYSWSIHPARDQEPGPTRVVGRPKGWLFFLMEVGISKNNGLSGPTGVVPTACNSWCIHHLCLMAECATAESGARRPGGPI